VACEVLEFLLLMDALDHLPEDPARARRDQHIINASPRRLNSTTDPSQQINESVGSKPMRLLKTEWLSGTIREIPEI
jgi:hypothetical protein